MIDKLMCLFYGVLLGITLLGQLQDGLSFHPARTMVAICVIICAVLRVRAEPPIFSLLNP